MWLCLVDQQHQVATRASEVGGDAKTIVADPNADPAADRLEDILSLMQQDLKRRAKEAMEEERKAKEVEENAKKAAETLKKKRRRIERSVGVASVVIPGILGAILMGAVTHAAIANPS